MTCFDFDLFLHISLRLQSLKSRPSKVVTHYFGDCVLIKSMADTRASSLVPNNTYYVVTVLISAWGVEGYYVNLRLLHLHYFTAVICRRGCCQGKRAVFVTHTVNGGEELLRSQIGSIIWQISKVWGEMTRSHLVICRQKRIKAAGGHLLSTFERDIALKVTHFKKNIWYDQKLIA